MKTITKYVTDDGEEFFKKEDAVRYEKSEKIKQGVAKLFFGGNGDMKALDDYQRQVVNDVIAERKKLIAILQEVDK